MAEGLFPKINGNKLYASEPNRMWNYCGDGSDGALHVTAGTVNLSGFKQYSSITVDVGTILNINSYATVLCSGDVTINGTLKGATVATTPVLDWFPDDAPIANPGGGTPAGGGETGGLSRYPLFLICKGILTLSATGVMTFSGTGGTNGTVDGGASKGGVGGGAGSFIGAGGAGGESNYLSGFGGGLPADPIDSYLKNQLYNLRGFETFGSQGGESQGAFGAGPGAGNGGSGAGAGSWIFIKSFEQIILEAGSSITVAGGAGGDGADGGGADRDSGGGGGGGGGLVQLLYKTGLTSSGTVTVAGGTGGSAGGATASPGAAGSAGVEINCKF